MQPSCRFSQGAFAHDHHNHSKYRGEDHHPVLRRRDREAILGATLFRDLFASVRDIVGGRSASYEKELTTARQLAFDELSEEAEKVGADAIVGVDIDYEVVGQSGSMLMVSVSGTAVVTS